MSESGISIAGGAGPFEAAAITAVISHVLEVERVARESRPPAKHAPAWVRAARPRNPDDPLDIVVPEHRTPPDRP